MKRVPHWIEAYRGVKAGFFDYMVNNEWQDYSHDEQRIIYAVHCALVTGVNDVYNFNTRDYAYDFGGMTVEDFELDEFDEYEYQHPGKAEE